MTVKGKPLTTTPSATTHPFAADAALPLTAILKELGASVVDGEDGLKTVTYGDKVYDLKMENYILFPSMEDRETGNDLLQVDGEPYFVYVSEGELMVKNCVLANVFWFMGIDCAIYIDEYNRTISIE